MDLLNLEARLADTLVPGRRGLRFGMSYGFSVSNWLSNFPAEAEVVKWHA